MGAGLFIEGEVRDRELQKDRVPATPISAFELFISGFTQAVLKFSRRDEVYFSEEALNLSSGPSAPNWMHEYRGRITPVSAQDFHTLRKNKNIVLLSLGPEMLSFAWLRSELHRPQWPICGILHGLAPAARLRYLVTNRLLDYLGPWDALVCSSTAAQRAMCNLFQAVPRSVCRDSFPPFQLPVIPPGINVADYGAIERSSARDQVGFAENDVVVLSLGRLAPSDTYDPIPLMLAFSRLRSKHKIRLVLAGDDTRFNMTERLRAVAPQLGCEDRVSVLPNVSRQVKQALLCAADIFICATENAQDSFALPILEAMASGLPVVASDWMSNRDLVADGQTGLLASTLLAPQQGPDLMSVYSGLGPEKLMAMSTAVDLDAMVQGLATLVENGELRRKMGCAGKQAALSKYDWREVIRVYDDLWDASCAAAPEVQVHPPIAAIPIQKVVAGFGTQVLENSVVLSRPEPRRDERGNIVRTLATTSFFKNEVFDALLNVIDTHGRLPLSSLIDFAGEQVDSSAINFERHVGRLVKYGLLSVFQERKDGPANN
jgi:D-inositol-3-phosphate glycosyltransferase